MLASAIAFFHFIAKKLRQTETFCRLNYIINQILIAKEIFTKWLELWRVSQINNKTLH